VPGCPDCLDGTDLQGILAGAIDPSSASSADQGTADLGLAKVTACPSAEAKPCGLHAEPGCTATIDRSTGELDVAGARFVVAHRGSARAFPILIEPILGAATTCSGDIGFRGDAVFGLVLEPADASRARIAGVLDPIVEGATIDAAFTGGGLCSVLESQEDLLVAGLVPYIEEALAAALADVRPTLIGSYVCLE